MPFASIQARCLTGGDRGYDAIADSLVTFVTTTAPFFALLVYRYETVVSKEAVWQGHFHVKKCNRANYITLNFPYYYLFNFFCSSMGHKWDHILSHCLFTIRKMGIVHVKNGHSLFTSCMLVVTEHFSLFTDYNDLHVQLASQRLVEQIMCTLKGPSGLVITKGGPK